MLASSTGEVPGTAPESLPTSQVRPRLTQLDLVRLVPMLGVIATHVLLYTAPPASRAAGALLMVLHVNRELFFFVSALVLAYSTGAAQRRFGVPHFWRRRYPLVAVPYLTWTVIYWLLLAEIQTPGVPSFRILLNDVLAGWFQLYFLLVTMQIYLVLPLLAWLVRRTYGRHWLVLLCSAALQVGLDWVFQYRPGLIPRPIFGLALWSDDEITSYQFYVVAGIVAAAHLPQLMAFARSHRRPIVLGALLTLLGGELVYLWNLHAGYLPSGASADLQPALLPLTLAAVALLWSAADWLVQAVPPEESLWHWLRRGSDLSFGVFLAHMIPLILLLQPGVADLLEPRGMAWEQVALLRCGTVLVATLAIVACLRRTPLSMPLTGRPWRRRAAPVEDAPPSERPLLQT
ncbi:MAG: acyltransferase [Candidatus Dormibacteraceae bacterium]